LTKKVDTGRLKPLAQADKQRLGKAEKRITAASHSSNWDEVSGFYVGYRLQACHVITACDCMAYLFTVTYEQFLWIKKGPFFPERMSPRYKLDIVFHVLLTAFALLLAVVLESCGKITKKMKTTSVIFPYDINMRNYS
jgi:hypothetical protein